MDDLPLSIPTNPVPAPPPEPPDPHQKRRVALAAGLALLWGIFTLLAQLSGALDAFEEPLLDWRLSLHAYPAPPSDQLALIAIDNIPADRPWPWSRLDYSLALRSLIDYAPQSVVFEMNLNDRDTEYTSFDDTFSHIVQRANTVVFAATVLTPPDTPRPLPAKLGSIPFHGSMRQVPRFGSAIWPLDTFAGDSPVGVNNLESESGLRLRRLPLVFMLDGKMIPSLVLQAAAQFLGADLASSEVQVGRAILLRRKDGKLLRTVPIDDEGRMRIRYHQGPGTSWQASFDNIMLYDDQIQHGITPGPRSSQPGPAAGLDRAHRSRRARTLQDRRGPAQPRRGPDSGRADHPRPGLCPPAAADDPGRALPAHRHRRRGRRHPIRPHPCGGDARHRRPRSGSSRRSSSSASTTSSCRSPSFAMLLFGAYAVGILASYWDLEPDEDSRQLPLDI